MYYDPYMLFADFASYVDCQAKVSEVYRRRRALDADVDSQHRAERQILIGSDDPRILRGYLAGTADADSAAHAERSRKRIVRRSGSAAPHSS